MLQNRKFLNIGKYVDALDIYLKDEMANLATDNVLVSVRRVACLCELCEDENKPLRDLVVFVLDTKGRGLCYCNSNMAILREELGLVGDLVKGDVSSSVVATKGVLTGMNFVLVDIDCAFCFDETSLSIGDVYTSTSGEFIVSDMSSGNKVVNMTSDTETEEAAVLCSEGTLCLLDFSILAYSGDIEHFSDRLTDYKGEKRSAISMVEQFEEGAKFGVDDLEETFIFKYMMLTKLFSKATVVLFDDNF